MILAHVSHYKVAPAGHCANCTASVQESCCVLYVQQLPLPLPLLLYRDTEISSCLGCFHQTLQVQHRINITLKITRYVITTKILTHNQNHHINNFSKHSSAIITVILTLPK
jgi:hypothetical protein